MVIEARRALNQRGVGRGAPALLTLAVGLASLACLLALLGSEAEGKVRAKCDGRKATVVGTNGNDVIKAPRGVQVIAGLGGNDRIFARRAKDVICGGSGDDYISASTGRDKVFGGAGDDFFDLGAGRDKAFGGTGDDVFVGGSGGDTVHGQDGLDRIFGGLQDDDLFGDGDDDAVIGGHGIDGLHGGDGNDWIRGDTNRDRYFGDGGNDTLSFATATPPGAKQLGGVFVDLSIGEARGDDSIERIFGIENLVGSAFDDELLGKGGGSVRGGLGPDDCAGFSQTTCDNGSSSSSITFLADVGSPDPGLTVFGDSGANSWVIRGSGNGVLITGSPLSAGGGCTPAGGDVFCRISLGDLGYVIAWGGSGNDAISFGSGLPQTTVLKADGGPGDDVIRGSKWADILHAGESGSDRIFGNGGDDALVARAGGGDRLFGGSGSDNLVSDNPCAGHSYNGGSGRADVAGFGHVTSGPINARIGGRARYKGSSCAGTRIKADLEILEGTGYNDILYASNRGDLLIGRDGRDRCVGGRHLAC